MCVVQRPVQGGVLRGLGLDIGNEFLAVAQCALGSVATGEMAQREKSQRAEVLVGDHLGKEGVTVFIGAHVLQDRIAQRHLVAIIGQRFILNLGVQQRHGVHAKNGGQIIHHRSIHAAFVIDDHQFGSVHKGGVLVLYQNGE